MLGKIQNDMDKYMYRTNVTSYSLSEWKDESYFFGYLDGYFDEELYIKYIMNDINNEERLKLYKSGFDKGLFDRKRAKAYEPKLLMKEKDEWIQKLVMYDTFNHVDYRNLKEDSFDAYNNYKTGPYVIKNERFIKDTSVDAISIHSKLKK